VNIFSVKPIYAPTTFNFFLKDKKMKSRNGFKPVQLKTGRWVLVAHYRVGEADSYSSISMNSWRSLEEAEAFRSANAFWPVRPLRAVMAPVMEK
jgi:hypothetical protein